MRRLLGVVALLVLLAWAACTTPGKEQIDADRPRRRSTPTSPALPDTTLSVWTSESGTRLDILKKLADEFHEEHPNIIGQVDGPRLRRRTPRRSSSRSAPRTVPTSPSATSAGRSTARSSRPACSARSTTTPRPTAGTRATPRWGCGSSSSPRTARSTVRVPIYGTPYAVGRHRVVLQQGPAERARHGRPADHGRARGHR